MRRLIPLAVLALALTGCPQKTDDRPKPDGKNGGGDGPRGG